VIALARAIAAMALAGAAAVGSQPPSPAARTEIVSVAGCVREQPPGTWMLVNASEPMPTPDGPVRIEPGTKPALGTNRFKLLGVGPFRLSSRRDHTVVVQGLLIGSAADRRLNVTSVQTVATTCAAAK
jgi:hypothetical protein